MMDAPRLDAPTKQPSATASLPVSELSTDDLALFTSFIDALVTKTRLKVLASGG